MKRHEIESLCFKFLMVRLARPQYTFNGFTRGNIAYQRDAVACHRTAEPPGTLFPRIGHKVPLLLEHGKNTMHTGRGSQAQVGPDLPHGGSVSAVANLIADELVDSPLLLGQAVQ